MTIRLAIVSGAAVGCDLVSQGWTDLEYIRSFAIDNICKMAVRRHKIYICLLHSNAVSLALLVPSS